MEKKQNDSLALIVGGLFILALVFATYNYFNKGKSVDNTLEKRIQELQKLENVKEGTTETATKEEGSINGEGAATTTINETSVTETPATNSQPQWVANDYKQGDITGDTYIVKSGDTLWEIAEAVYGDGSQWVKLLNANSSNIGQLANGQQALIMPGQVLNIVR